MMTTLPQRLGTRPSIASPMPRVQMTGNGPSRLSHQLERRLAALPNVMVSKGMIAPITVTSFTLPPLLTAGLGEQLRETGEFAHVHGSGDGSLHVVLPDELGDEARMKGWAEPHPFTPGAYLVYAPRTDDELDVVWSLLQTAYEYAQGESHTTAH